MSQELSDVHRRFSMPDELFAAGATRQQEIRFSDDPPDIADFASDLASDTTWVRGLLRLRLHGGGEVTYGVWIATTMEVLRTIAPGWDDPATYANVTFSGHLANAIPALGFLGAPVSLAVEDVDAMPYVQSSTDPDLSRALTSEHDAATLLTS